MNKPPAFQFYAKDWRSSATVRGMRLSDKGVLIELLAAAWDSDEPGTLPIQLREIGKITGIDQRILAEFFRNHRGIFRKVAGKLRNEKLYAQSQKLREISEKRSNAAQSSWPRDSANAEQMQKQKQSSASATASATAAARGRQPFLRSSQVI